MIDGGAPTLATNDLFRVWLVSRVAIAATWASSWKKLIQIVGDHKIWHSEIVKLEWNFVGHVVRIACELLDINPFREAFMMVIFPNFPLSDLVMAGNIGDSWAVKMETPPVWMAILRLSKKNTTAKPIFSVEPTVSTSYPTGPNGEQLASTLLVHGSPFSGLPLKYQKSRATKMACGFVTGRIGRCLTSAPWEPRKWNRVVGVKSYFM